MKAAILILLIAARSQAQTNTPIFISFTNSTGDYITNAEVTKVLPNKLYYEIPSGGGCVRMDALPESERAQFNYDPYAANQADTDDALKKIHVNEAEKQRVIAFEKRTMQQAQQSANENAFNDLLNARVEMHRVQIVGTVVEIGPDGLVINPSRENQPDMLLQGINLPVGASVYMDAYRIGNYKIDEETTEFGSTVISYYNVYTTDFSAARQFYYKSVMDQFTGKKQPSASSTNSLAWPK